MITQESRRSCGACGRYFLSERTANAWTGDVVQSHLLAASAAHAAQTRRAELHDAGGATFLILPLIENNERVAYVLAIRDYELADAPMLLHALHGSARHFAQTIHVLSQIVLTARADGEIDYASRRWLPVTGTSIREMPIRRHHRCVGERVTVNTSRNGTTVRLLLDSGLAQEATLA